MAAVHVSTTHHKCYREQRHDNLAHDVLKDAESAETDELAANCEKMQNSVSEAITTHKACTCTAYAPRHFPLSEPAKGRKVLHRAVRLVS